MNSNIELRHIKYFLMLAQDLNFARAAQHLNITQPPLTRQIRRLEESLGVVLFYRTTRSVELTEAGKSFLPEARAILDRIERGIAVVKQELEDQPQHIAVAFEGSINGALLPRAIRKFRERHPLVELELCAIDTQEQIAALREHKIDAGFVVGPVAHPDMSVTTVAKIPLMVVLPDRYAMANRPSIRLADLKSEKFILSPAMHICGLYEYIMTACQKLEFEPNVVLEARDMHLMLGFVAEGLGITILPDVMQGPPPPGITYVPMDTDTGGIEVAIVRRRGDNSRVLTDLAKYVRECALPGGPRDSSSSDRLLKSDRLAG